MLRFIPLRPWQNSSDELRALGPRNFHRLLRVLQQSTDRQLCLRSSLFRDLQIFYSNIGTHLAKVHQ